MKKIKLLNNKVGVKLEKIDSKEIAYLIGFACANSSVANNNSVELGIKLEDKEILDFLGEVLDSKVNIDNNLNRKAKRFPRARFTKNIVDILSFIKSRLKDDRILPIVSKELERYLVLGFFDGDGCLTWGKRKDRNRIWYKVCFTSSFKMLIHLQKILQKIEIASIVRPKTNEKTFVLEFSSKKDVLKFCSWLYEDKDFVILKRKFNNYNALRLELDKFGETALISTIPSRA